MTAPELRVATHGNGPDLWLLHGWAMHGGVFQELAARLARSHCVHVVDLPGHGASSEQPFDLDALATALAARITRPAWIIGWSLGGLLAQQFALAHADRVRGLALLSTTPRFMAGPDWVHGVSADVLEAFARGLDADVRGVLARFIALQGLGQPLANVTALRRAVLDAPMPAHAALRDGLRVLRETDLRAQVWRIRVPALLIHGARDRVTPPGAARWLAQALPHARLEMLDDAGHAPFIGYASEVQERVEAFIREH